MKRRYLHKRMIMDFSLGKIAYGVEEMLAEPVDVVRNADRDGLLLLTAKFRAESSYSSTPVVSIWIDPEEGELVKTECKCSEFQRDYFSCSHILSVLGKYILEEEKEELKGTDLYRVLQETTKVEDPFIPGILRKTDASLQTFLVSGKHEHIKPDKPGWMQEKSQKKVDEKLSIETILNFIRYSASLELKAGPKRHYVIRNLENLLTAYIKNGRFSFTNNITCYAGRAKYDPSAWPVLDFIGQLVQKHKNGVLGYSVYSSGSNEYYRYLKLTGRDLDAFMEMLDQQRIQISINNNQTQNYDIDFQKEPEALTVRKEEFGAVIQSVKEIPLACGMDYMYLVQNNTVMRLPSSQWEQRKGLAEAFGQNTELYVQEKDLPALCDSLSMMGIEKEQLKLEGLFPEKYFSEKPEILIYLDHPQDDLISCEVKAHYTFLNKDYNVLDQRKDKSKRDILSEQYAGEEIWQYFSAFDEEKKMMFLECDENTLYHFLTDTIPALAQIGEIFISDKLKKLKVRPVGEVSVGLQVEAGSLVMSLQSNTLSKEEMIEILSSYNSKKRFTRLKNGEFVVLSEADMSIWDTISDTYKNYGKKNPEAMKLPLFRALYLQECLQDRDNLQLEQGQEYQNLIYELKHDDPNEYQEPDSLKEILRPYQKEGYRWLCMLKKNGFGGILADDMGLGKTLQVLAFLLSEKQKGKNEKTLIVAPASLIYNWKKEIERFTPELSCKIIAGSIGQRKADIRQIKDGDIDVYITSYDLLKRDILLYEEIHFENQFIDEAQYIKNQNTQVAKAVRLIDSAFRMALTGTPIENRLSELWSIFDYLMPGFLYGYTRFRSDYEAPIINDHDEVIMKRLRSMVHPFILRRLKKDVLTELPDKLEETVTISMEGEQRKLYDAYAERLRLSLDKQSDEEFHQKKLEILAELTRLRQICCGPDLFLENYKGENAKKEACMELVRQAISGGHKILLFSQFTTVLDDLGKTLKKEKIEYHRIDGSVKKEERMRQVESFATDEVPLFLISLKAGGTGLNLTAADIVIHYDPWWNIAAQNQATDRTHRIGQENTVTVYQLITEKTIEEQIAILQKTKAQLAEDILSGEGIASIMIDKNELIGLLG